MVSPVYGEKHPIVYISICSIVGSFLVLSAQGNQPQYLYISMTFTKSIHPFLFILSISSLSLPGFGAAMAYSFANWHTDNQFTQWPLYPTLAFVIATVVMQINYLNKALNLFSTAIVTPVYYVFFTGCTLLSSAILFQGFKGISVIGGISILIGFVIIVGGVALLFQYSLKLGKFTALQQQQQNGGGGSPITSPAGEEDEEDAEIRKNAEAAALVVNKYKNKHSNSTNKLNGGSPVKSANVSAHELFPPKQIDSTYRDGSMDSYAVEMDHLNNGGGGGGGVRLTNKNIGQILTSSPLQKKSSSMDPDKISLVNSVAPSTKRSFDDHLIDVSPDKSTAAAGPVLVPSRTSITLDRPQPITTATTSITTAAANGNGFGHHYQESSEATARASNSNLLGVDVGRRGSNAFLDEPL